MHADEPRQRAYGGLFAVAILLLGALLLADVLVADMGRTSNSVGGGSNIGANETARYHSVQAAVGDLVNVPVSSDLPQAIVLHRVLIVEGGQGDAAVRGEAEHVYGEREVRRGDASVALVVVRPEPPGGSPAHDHLDIVHVFTHDPALERPDDPAAQRYFDDWMRATTTPLVSTPTVTSASALTFHDVAVPLIRVLMVVGVVTGGLWARRALGAGPAADDGVAASAVALLDIGGRTLRFLRALLVALVLPLAYASWLTLYFFWNPPAEFPGTGPSWGALQSGAAVVLVAAVAAWSVTLAVVLRALRRYRDRPAPPSSFA